MLMVYLMLSLIIGYLIALASARLPVMLAPSLVSAEAARASRWSGRFPTSPLWRDVMVVVATLTLFGWLWQRFGPSGQLIWVSVYASLFMLIAVIDLEHRLVLNGILLPSFILALIASWLAAGPPLLNALIGCTVGFGLFAVLAAAWPGAMGGGDVKLAGLIGLITGFPEVLVALICGIMAGGVAAAFLLATRANERRSYMPYAPFLVFGALIGLLYGSDILDWYIHIWRR